MVRPTSHSETGFTLLEICIAVAIAALVIVAAVPTINGALNGSREQNSFAQFDQLAQDAHSRSLEERRAYSLFWSRDLKGNDYILLRADAPANKDEEGGVRKFYPQKDEEIKLFLPASLPKGGIQPTVAIWTFWPSGVCEPASVTFKSKKAKWSANYSPFTAQAEVNYD